MSGRLALSVSASAQRVASSTATLPATVVTPSSSTTGDSSAAPTASASSTSAPGMPLPGSASRMIFRREALTRLDGVGASWYPRRDTSAPASDRHLGQGARPVIIDAYNHVWKANRQAPEVFMHEALTPERFVEE